MEQISKKQVQLIQFALKCMKEDDLPALTSKLDEFAVEKKATVIQSYSQKGDSILFNSCKKSSYLPFLEYFVNDCGVDPIKPRPGDDHTAVHHAITHKNCSAVEFLLENNTNCCEGFSKSILLYAASLGRKRIANHIIETAELAEIDIIHTYELLGCAHLEDRRTTPVDESLWRKSMEMRWKDPSNPVLKTIPEGRSEAYLDIPEPQNMEELDDLMKNRFRTKINCCLIWERILGPAHHGLINQLHMCFVYMIDYDTVRRPKCCNVLKYGLSLCSNADAIKYEMQTIGCWLNFSFQWVKSGRLALTTEDLVNMTVSLATGFSSAINDQASFIRKPISQASSERIMTFICNAINFAITRPGSQATQPTSYEENFKRICQMNLHDRQGRSLLHYAVQDPSRWESMGDGYFLNPDAPPCSPRGQLVEKLVECGVDVNSMNCERKTPLFTLADFLLLECSKNERNMFSPVADILIENGAHTDVSSVDGTWLYDRLKEALPDYDKLKRINLQCLSALAVADSGVEYETVVSDQLISFIKLHQDVFVPPE